MFKKLYIADKKAKIAQFMSGSGTNVIKVLEQEKKLGKKCPYETVVIVTDNKKSKALEIGNIYDKPVIEFDIRDFQESKGLSRKLTLATQEYRKVREEYTNKLSEILFNLFTIDFAVFGGFEPLTNITKYIPCLNVHPGDLSYLKNGKRHLVGLYTIPIQKAIDERIGYVRSSVIQAMPYTGRGENMDDGPLLGLGPKLLYENKRDTKKIQNALKKVSDWVILPAVVLATAQGKIEVNYKTNEVKNQIVMDLEYRISEIMPE